MKEFKFCGEITEYVEIPVYVCETQKEMVKEISEIRDVLTFVDEARENLLDTAVSNEEETSVYIIYKDGSIYFKTLDEEEGKFKRYGIKAAVIETAYEYTVFGDFAVTDNGDISIEESDIEEYGVYNGQYDVKEQDEQEVQEAVEQTEVEETAELETETNETTVETVKKTEKVIKKPETEEAVETIAEQTQADEAAETEPAKTPKSENVPYKMKWTNQNVDYSRANYTAVIFKFNNSKVWLQLDCVCSTQTVRATIRKLGKWFGSKSVDVKYFSDQTNEKIVSVCQLYDNSGYIFRNEIAVKNGEKRQFIKYAAKEIFE